MTLTNLRLVNFRSYEKAEFEFDPRLTAIIGPNGSGKTNILEAIYTLSMTKSFRGNASALSKDGKGWFYIGADLDAPGLNISLAWKNSQKQLQVNQTKVRLQDYLGNIPIALFEPGSIDIVAGPPQLRRAWLDRVLASTDKHYLKSLVQYRRVLKQRNSLLKQPGNTTQEQIFAWDVILSEHAEVLAQTRLEFVEYINLHIGKEYKRIAKTQDEISASYTTAIDEKNYRDNLLNQLQTRLPEDQRQGFTSMGPHRDDLLLSYNQQPLSRVGSRGENRTAVIALVRCELGYLKKHTQRPPVLLLDDVLSELDSTRQQALIDASLEVQTVITSTSLPSDIGDHATIKL